MEPSFEERINAVDWPAYATAYGRANDVPSLLLALASSDHKAAMVASQRSVDGYVYVDRLLKQKYLDAHDETSRLRALVSADKLAIANLEEEARRADVPPGWLRR